MWIVSLGVLWIPVAAAQSAAPQVLQDCSDCPEMVVIPAGSFIEGGNAAETEREQIAKELAGRELPPTRVTIARKFAIGKFEVTRGQFAKFVAETQWKIDGPCSGLEDGPTNRWAARDDRNWQNPGFKQTDDHPVVCVNLKDVHAYTAWLSRKTVQRYRLPSNAEWEYAARAGTTTARPWGDGYDEACLYANGSDISRAKAHNAGKADPARFFQCDDGYAETAPVGGFKPNSFGLHDVLGNVLEWASDCLNASRVGAPADGRARRTGDCNSQIDRGGSWTNSPRYVRIATQHSDLVHARNTVLGFRLVREIAPEASSPCTDQSRECIESAALAFRDCADCPDMVVVPAGSASIGSSREETARELVAAKFASRERPRHTITIGAPFAVGRTEVTRAQFAAFVRETQRPAGDGCFVWNFEKAELKKLADKSWRDPGFPQTDRDPVVCVSWEDAVAYAEWMGRKTGHAYRLPSEAEWEYAARGGTSTARYWGDSPEKGCANANVFDRTAAEKLARTEALQELEDRFQCTDGHAFTAPVASFAPNPFGLYDMLGNVGEWTADCAHADYTGAPADGSAWVAGECRLRSFRGGSWRNSPRYIRAAARYSDPADGRYGFLGFRLVRPRP